MSADSTINALNQLLVIHNRSLPQYLSYAPPTWKRGEEPAQAVLRVIAADQQEMVDRLGALIIELNGTPDYGNFPMVYTGYHDLSFDFLLKRMIEGQQREIRQIEQCVDRLSLNPLARAIAEESLGAAKGHLESLQELQHPAPQAA